MAAQKKKKTRRPPRQGLMGRMIRWTLLLGILGGVIGVSALAGIFYYYGQDLPKVLSREDFKPAQMSKMYASGGELIAEFSIAEEGGKRTVVPMERIPKHVQWAFMAAEDADFMTHSGIDYLGLVRAFYYAIVYDTGLKGTSTITQQVVKNLILTPKKSVRRKVREIILSMELEKNLSKEDILWMYLNEIYLGHGVNGIEEAAKLYFGKPAKDLTLPEAATLAGMTQSPERHSPFRNPQNARKRRAFVLKQLWEKGFIQEAAYREADASPLKLAPRDTRAPYLGQAPYFVEHVRRLLIEQYGQDVVYKGGMRVHTTLDLRKQRAAEQSLRDGLRAYDKRHGLYRPQKKLSAKVAKQTIDNASKQVRAGADVKSKTRYKAVVTKVDASERVVHVRIGKWHTTLYLEPAARIFGEADSQKSVADVFQVNQLLYVWKRNDTSTEGVMFEPGPEGGALLMDPTNRDVLALVGGFDHTTNKYNHATQAMRQPGSTFKPFVYAAALEAKTITPATIIIDQPEVFKMPNGGTYSPRNSDGKYRGPIRVREGLGASRNVIAVHILVKKLGLDKAIAFAKKIGITSPLERNVTLVMGSASTTVLQMVNAYATFASGGRLGPPRFLTKVVLSRSRTEQFKPESKPVISQEVAYLITDLMLAVTSGYTDSQGKRRAGTASNVSKLGHPVAGKTGTTNEAKDTWFVGYTPYYTGGVWVGYPDNRALGSKEYGGRTAAPIWLGMMKGAHAGKKVRRFEPPSSGITTANIDPKTGLLMRSGGIVETFLAGTAPVEYAPEAEEGSIDDFLIEQVAQ